MINYLYSRKNEVVNFLFYKKSNQKVVDMLKNT